MVGNIAIGRRSFLYLSAAVVGLGGKAGANSRIGTGHIGVGQRGRALLKGLQESAVALCDPDERSLHAGAALTRPGIHLMKDYRALLERADVDAVVIASPDHWHAAQLVHACEAGKDVYVEMPVCNTLGEARAMLQAARRYGTVVGCGADGPLTEPMQRLRAQVATGGLGAVSKVTCWAEPSNMGPDGASTETTPPQLDWDLWQGPARERPYSYIYMDGAWRWFLELGGGNVRHQGGHTLTSCLAALDRQELGTVTVTANGGQYKDGPYDCPRTLSVQWDLSGLSVVYTQETEGRPAPFGGVLEGASKSATILRGDGETTVQPEPAAPEDPLAMRQETALENWLRMIPGRGTPMVDMAAGARATTLVTLANLAFHAHRPLTWDDTQGAFLRDAQAQRLVLPLARGPWRL